MAEFRSSVDVVALNTSESVIGMIVEAAKAIPELNIFAASPVDKTYYKTMVRTSLPSAGFRKVGEGRVRDVGEIVARVVQCGFLDASWSQDNAYFTGSQWADLEAELAEASLLAALKAWQSRLYNGADDAERSGGFPGLCTLWPYKDGDGVVDAGGTTAATGSSIYSLKTGTRDVSIAWGNGGVIQAGEVFSTEIAQLVDDELVKMNGRAQNVEGWAGLQITNHRSVVRTCNLTADSGKGCTDFVLNAARTLFAKRYGMLPDYHLMSYRSLQQLQDSRTQFNATNDPAPVPRTDSAGVPLVATLGITDTETLLEDEGT